MVELIIKNTSQELFLETIRTLPFEPKGVEIDMVADGIQFPIYGEKDGEKKYLSECKEHNVIPYSRIQLEYKNDWFLPEQDRGIFPYGFNMPEQSKKVFLDSLVKGGKIHNFKIEISGIYCIVNKGFQKFRDEFLDTMINNDYQLQKGNLRIDCCDSGVNEEVAFSKNILVLFLDELFEEQEGSKIKGWFNHLKDKYQYKQEFLFS